MAPPLKRAKVSVNVEPKSFANLVTEIQCSKCKIIPGPGPEMDNRRFRCNSLHGHPLCIVCIYLTRRDSNDNDECLSDGCAGYIADHHCQLTEALLQAKIIPWPCRNYQHGCREAFRDETELFDHQAECIYRQITCFHQAYCGGDEVCFKDFLDHFSNCGRDENLPRVFKSTGRFAIDVGLRDIHAYNKVWFYPDKIEAHGKIFFFVLKLDNDHYRMWIFMHSSSHDVKIYEWRLKINSGGKEEYVFRGEPIAIDVSFDDVLKKQDGFPIGIRKAEEIRERLGKFEVMIEIRSLKEEAKDKDAESGVSSEEGE